ncbi:MAG: NYN domain-containing protein [Erysipelotrichaceae bacterium]|jgi:uncharacterized protein (TIGR00288 family)|nr:NYN domain-containing protein [Erysipelotrichaceae bacterium]
MNNNNLNRRMALLIDADNVSHKYIKLILNELSNHGIVTYRRAYADWTMDIKRQWKQVCLENSITPVQSYSYTTGKNSSDASLTIDAMDILYANNVDGFCIVTSDSDFIHLVHRLRESGKYVLGMGERNKTNNLEKAFNRFIYLESLVTNEEEETPSNNKTNEKQLDGSDLKFFTKVLLKIIDEIDESGGYVRLSEVGGVLYKRHPEFDARNYKEKSLSNLAKKIKQLEVVEENDPNNELIKIVFVKIKRK